MFGGNLGLGFASSMGGIRPQSGHPRAPAVLVQNDASREAPLYSLRSVRRIQLPQWIYSQIPRNT
jgi:hypothetical protein